MLSNVCSVCSARNHPANPKKKRGRYLLHILHTTLTYLLLISITYLQCSKPQHELQPTTDEARNEPMTNYTPLHDPIVHGRLTELFDLAEEELVSQGFCAPDDVEQHLFDRYIEAVNTNMSGCSQYLLTEEQCAAESFIIDLCAFVQKPGLAGKAWKMAAQLMCQPTIYFRNYLQMLTTAYVNTLREVEDALALRHSGVFLLAAAALPGWYHDARRELRRRGYRFDPTLVSDELSAQRVRAIEGLPPVGKGRKRISRRPS